MARRLPFCISDAITWPALPRHRMSASPSLSKSPVPATWKLVKKIVTATKKDQALSKKIA